MCASMCNLWSVQRCEASKYFFYLRYESGPIYKPSSRDFELVLREAVSDADRSRIASIWNYWESAEGGDVTQEDELHPDHRVE